jgi:hypothetical protein
MAGFFQSAVTFVQMKCFSKFLLRFACVKTEEKLCKKLFLVWLKMALLAQGVGQKWFF